MRYETPAALRQAIDARLVRSATATAVPVNRLRRRLAFERLLARLAANDPGHWILKGGMALEMRWLERARATKDLDLAMRAAVRAAADARELLIAALAQDPDDDRFSYEVGPFNEISADMAGRRGWRVGLRAVLAGRVFAPVTLDVVARSEEIAGTETLRLPGGLSFAEIPVREIEAVDLAQHFAEKVHAFTRTYAGGEPSSRARDLIDLVLIIEEKPPEPDRVRMAIERVFAARGTHEVPEDLPDPPAGWGPRYEELASDLVLEAATLGAAMELVRTYWGTTKIGGRDADG